MSAACSKIIALLNQRNRSAWESGRLTLLRFNRIESSQIPTQVLKAISGLLRCMFKRQNNPFEKDFIAIEVVDIHIVQNNELGVDSAYRIYNLEMKDRS